MKKINGSVCSAKGFLSLGVHVGIKKRKADLAIIKTEKEAVYAGVFTKNKIKASCVNRNIKLLNKKEKVKAIVINSGNANACTGSKGDKDNLLMASSFAKLDGCNTDNVLTASTGVIGQFLPIDKITKGINNLYTALNTIENDKLLKINNLNDTKKSSLIFSSAEKAILTTDTFIKNIAFEFFISNKKITIGAMAKGSGMIEPNMATMLSFITTDLNISDDMLQKALSDSVEKSYNMISVDGDTSTNDMVVILANGSAGNNKITSENEEFDLFKKCLDEINIYLAKEIVKDGEGATKLLEVDVCGCEYYDDAKNIAKSLINSSLVKTALFASDANWGRIIAAIGYSDVKTDINNVEISIKSKKGEIKIYENNAPCLMDEVNAKEILLEKEIFFLINLHKGKYRAKAWGCDLSYEYVRINAEYRS